MGSQEIQIRVRLSPKAAKNAVQGWARDADGHPVLKACVTAVPEKGKANKALVELLAKEWKIPKSSISVIRGETDRNKTLLLNNISDDLAARIKAGTPP